MQNFVRERNIFASAGFRLDFRKKIGLWIYPMNGGSNSTKHALKSLLTAKIEAKYTVRKDASCDKLTFHVEFHV